MLESQLMDGRESPCSYIRSSFDPGVNIDEPEVVRVDQLLDLYFRPISVRKSGVWMPHWGIVDQILYS